MIKGVTMRFNPIGRRALSLAVALAFIAFPAMAQSYDDVTKAAIDNNLAVVKKHVELLDVNLARSPILAAYAMNAKSFDAEVWKYLVERGADPNWADSDGVTPLGWAAHRLDHAAVEAMLASGADPLKASAIPWLGAYSNLELRSRVADGAILGELDSKSRLLPLQIAIIRRNVGAFRTLLAATPLGAVAPIKSGTAAIPLDALPLLRYHDESLSIPPLNGMIMYRELDQKNRAAPEGERLSFDSPLADIAAKYVALDDLAGLKGFLREDPKLSKELIPYAAALGSVNSLELFLALNDLSWNATFPPSLDLPLATLVSYSEETVEPLYAFALLSGNLAALKAIGDKGADLARTFSYVVYKEMGDSDFHEDNALRAAARLAPGSGMAEYALAKGVDPNTAGRDGRSPLMLAIISGDQPLVNVLLKAKANPNYANEDSLVPLHFASAFGRIEAVSALLAVGANPILQDRRGFTALHYAADARSLEITRLLVAKAPALALAKTTTFVFLDETYGEALPAGSTALDLAKLLLAREEHESERVKLQELVAYLSSLAPKK